jgi:hypothetical protein
MNQIAKAINSSHHVPSGMVQLGFAVLTLFPFRRAGIQVPFTPALCQEPAVMDTPVLGSIHSPATRDGKRLVMARVLIVLKLTMFELMDLH